MTPFFLSLPILLSATMPQSDATGFPPSGTVWTLSAVDGAAFDGNATLSFGEDGRIAGKGPCNTYTGALDGTPEEFSVGPLATTKMACPDMQPEQAFLDALQAMTTATMDGDTITLMAPDGRSMTFAQAQPGASVASDQEAPAEQAAPETAPDPAPTTEAPAGTDAADQGAAPEAPEPTDGSATEAPAADPAPAEDGGEDATEGDAATPPAATDSSTPDMDAPADAPESAQPGADASANGSEAPAPDTSAPATGSEAPATDTEPAADAPAPDADAPVAEVAPETPGSAASGSAAPEPQAEPSADPPSESPTGSEQGGTLTIEEDPAQTSQ